MYRFKASHSSRLFVVTALLVCSTAQATDWFEWNGHEYALVAIPMYWENAQAYAETAMQNDPDGLYTGEACYLVCITTAAEEQFVFDTFCPSGHGAWIGGYQDLADPNYSEPGGGWKWVNGEPMAYTNWKTGEPNNQGIENWMQWGCNGAVSWWNDQYHSARYSIVEREGPPCDLCNSANGCDYTCLNWENVDVSPSVATAAGNATVSLDYEISGTDGHIIYVGLVVDGQCLPFYSGIPGAAGSSGFAELSFQAPATPGGYDIKIAVAHVYNELEFCDAVADGSADMAVIDALCVTVPEDLDLDGSVGLSDLALLLARYGWSCN